MTDSEREAVARAIRKRRPVISMAYALELADDAIAALDAWRAGQRCHWRKHKAVDECWKEPHFNMLRFRIPEHCPDCGKRVEVKHD